MNKIVVVSVMTIVGISGLALGGPTLPASAAQASSVVFSSYEDGRFNLYAANRDGRNSRRLTNSSMNQGSPAVSPNQKQIAYVESTPEDYQQKLALLDLDTQQTRTLLDEKNIDYIDPVWSPDGKQLAYTTTSGEGEYKSCLHTLTIATLATRDVICGGTLLYTPDWSPDGQRLLYSEYNRATNGKLYTVDLSLQGQKKFIHNGSSGSFSPQGDKVSYSGYDAAYATQVFVSNSDGSSPRQMTYGNRINTAADWADDNLITYLSVDHTTFEFQIKSISEDGTVQLDFLSKSTDIPGKGLL